MLKKKHIGNKVNIRDIAAQAGLSISTVSRVLNGKADEYRISKKSQKLVTKIAGELNYVPNQFAANLKSGKSRTIALMVPSLDNPFFAKIASNINSEIRKYGYHTIISDSGENPDIEKTELRQLIARNIEGLIIVPCGNNYREIKELHNQGLPLVCIDRYFDSLDIPYVATDNYSGAYLATKNLIDHGHHNIVCIQGVSISNTNKLRVKGFTEALTASGIEKFKIIGNDFTTKNGYCETQRLIDQGTDIPTAIFTLSNTIAMGCMKALKENNLKVPEDISLITFDDHPYLDFLSTPLTSIAQPTYEISKKAVDYIFSILLKKELRNCQLLLEPKLKIRKSVCNVR